jgi:hypothetical protein
MRRKMKGKKIKDRVINKRIVRKEPKIFMPENRITITQ